MDRLYIVLQLSAFNCAHKPKSLEDKDMYRHVEIVGGKLQISYRPLGEANAYSEDNKPNINRKDVALHRFFATNDSPIGIGSGSRRGKDELDEHIERDRRKMQ